MPEAIPTVTLDGALHNVHKTSLTNGSFGLDGSTELIDGGFGLYSNADLKPRVGPIKTQYYRIAFVRRGSVRIDQGLETLRPKKHHMVFGFPGQVFSLQDASRDFKVFYLLFNEEFMSASPLWNSAHDRLPFFSHAGVPLLELAPDEAARIEELILRINDEIKVRQPHLAQAIRLNLHLLLLHARRSCERQHLHTSTTPVADHPLPGRFSKLVAEHFLTHRKVSDYADMLHVSADHLNRSLRKNGGRTAGELIEEMLLREAKARLRHGDESMSEIAYALRFTDPSHFNKFFKKFVGATPSQYRAGSE
jgi:AraC family transcriptional activator of pobA